MCRGEASMTDSVGIIVLALEGDGLGESAIRSHELTLRRMIRENVADGHVEEPSTERQKQGTKGDPVTIGLITIALIKSGAVVALLNCIKAIVVRERKLKIKIKTKSGETIDVDSKNVDSDALRQQLRELLEANTRP